jgi:hypothetical protein
MARRRRDPRPTVDDRIDDIRHGEPFERSRYYRIRACDLTAAAAQEWSRAEVRLEDCWFTDLEFHEMTGRRLHDRDEV